MHPAGADWGTEIAKAEKFMQGSWKRGRQIYARYADDRDADTYASAVGLRRVNIFFSNTNTIAASLYNSLPRPDVSRLHKGETEDEASRVAALILQRALTYEVHCAPWFDAAIKSAILDRLVPGVGQLWVRFQGATEVAPEQVAVDTVYWEDFLYQPARTWVGVNWVGRRLHLTMAEVRSRYGEEGEAVLSTTPERDAMTPKEIEQGTYCVYEIWDRTTKKVIHWAKGAEKPLLELEDPLRLTNFFPCPAPLIANTTTVKYLPVPDFHIAEDQYIVMDTLMARINLIIESVKVAGVYDAGSPEIGRMLQGCENKLIPVDNWAMFAEKGGAKGTIDWFPVEHIVPVLQQLQAAYEFTKQTLYEVTGMSDILRGASNPYETAAAQGIKAQFASVRMNQYQRDVATFVRDTLRIVGELVCQLYSDQKLQLVVGDLPQPDLQFIPQAVAILRNDFLLKYNVDIGADSLTQADWAMEKSQRLEFMQAMSQFLNSAVPAIRDAPELGPLLLQMVKFSIAGFKGAAEMEGWVDQQLDALLKASQQPPQPPPPSPEAQQAQMELQMSQQKMQMEMQKLQMEMQQDAQDAQLRQQESVGKLAVSEQEMRQSSEAQQQELQYKQQKANLELEYLAAKYQLELEKAQVELQIAKEKGALSLGATVMDLKGEFNG